jgi:hypothetical protein
MTLRAYGRVKRHGGRAAFCRVTVQMVISHDCDLADDDLDAEPLVEVVIVRPIEMCDGNFTHAKSTRTLHLEVTKNGRLLPCELHANRKATVTKTSLARFVPDADYSLAQGGKIVLQSWLAARYKRAPFPDNLMVCLDKIRDLLQDIGKKSGTAIIGFFISFEPDKEDLEQGERYELSFSVVYSVEVNGARAIAEDAAKRINAKLERHFKIGGVWKKVELVNCAALSETEFTYFDLTHASQYRLEYISLRQSPPAPDV